MTSYSAFGCYLGILLIAYLITDFFVREQDSLFSSNSFNAKAINKFSCICWHLIRPF